jgi:short-subunit dehydrogenase
MRHVVIVGATDGIGLALAREYAARSWRVAVVGRAPGKVQEVVASLGAEHPAGSVVGQVLDVTRRDAVAPALEAALEALGQMDLLVYVAGVLGHGPAAAEEMLRVNTLGAMDVMEWGADYFVQAGGGHLVAVGSIAGDRGRKSNPAYAASKAALHEYLEGLRARLHASRVKVTTIKPGWVRTRMLGEVPAFPPAISPAKAARIMRRGIERGRDAFYVPAWWGLISLVLRAMPRALFKRVAPP